MNFGLLKRGFSLGSVAGVIGLCALPVLNPLEIDWGGAWLFGLRGKRPAPDEVRVVTIDQESSRRLGLPNIPRLWPRSLHAQLVRNLTRWGARVIAFDVRFEQGRKASDDEELARAIREAGNVVLFAFLAKETHPASDGQTEAVIERIIPPIPLLADAAAGSAPFPLPKLPVKVHQYWLFKPEAGDGPTLPVVAMQVYARPEYRRTLEPLLRTQSLQSDQGLDEFQRVRAIRQLFQSQADLMPHLSARLRSRPATEQRVLAALLEAYSGPDSRLLDFYGPPRTIPTLPYHRLLDGGKKRTDIAGKAVFIGFSENRQPEQTDAFYSVFSDSEGLDVSGVEIAATAFANILERRHGDPPPLAVRFLMVGVWGLLLGVLFMLLPAFSLIPLVAVLAPAYVGVAWFLFNRDGTWLPLVTPLLVQLPFALISALLWLNRETHRERERMRAAFSHYVPVWVVEQTAHERQALSCAAMHHYGICLKTDIEQYTRLAEGLPPAQVHAALNAYYQHLFAAVTKHGGSISDVVGDAMLALWTAPTETPDARLRACQAALEIATTVNAAPGGLSTRIGLHCGELVLANVGADEHYEFSPVGDVVNSSDRVERLNKRLGTHLLASREVIIGLDEISARGLGSFLLPGKSIPLEIYEILGPASAASARDDERLFADGLRLFRSGAWQEACQIFSGLLERRGMDGPCRFYLSLCEQYLQHPPGDWQGIVDLRSPRLTPDRGLI